MHVLDTKVTTLRLPLRFVAKIQTVDIQIYSVLIESFDDFIAGFTANQEQSVEFTLADL